MIGGTGGMREAPLICHVHIPVLKAQLPKLFDSGGLKEVGKRECKNK